MKSALAALAAFSLVATQPASAQEAGAPVVVTNNATTPVTPPPSYASSAFQISCAMFPTAMRLILSDVLGKKDAADMMTLCPSDQPSSDTNAVSAAGTTAPAPAQR